MPREQARNIVLHGHPNGPQIPSIHVATKEALPEDLAHHANTDPVRLAIGDMTMLQHDKPNLTTTQKIHEELEKAEKEAKATAAKTSKGGLVIPSPKDIEQFATPQAKEPSDAQKQRVVIFNRLYATANTWHKELSEGKSPTFTLSVQDTEGNRKQTKQPVTEHLLFALYLTYRSMYKNEISKSPAKPLVDMIKQHPFDEDVVKRALKMKKTIQNEDDSTTEDNDIKNHAQQDDKETNSVEETTSAKSPKDKQVKQVPVSFEKQVIFTMQEVDMIIHPQKPSEEAATYINDLLEKDL